MGEAGCTYRNLILICLVAGNVWQHIILQIYHVVRSLTYDVLQLPLIGLERTERFRCCKLQPR
jgi:hypothetical protein